MLHLASFCCLADENHRYVCNLRLFESKTYSYYHYDCLTIACQQKSNTVVHAEVGHVPVGFSRLFKGNFLKTNRARNGHTKMENDGNFKCSAERVAVSAPFPASIIDL